MAQSGTSPPSWPSFARQVIACAVRGSDPASVPPAAVASRPHAGVFVTLHQRRMLRGCMGILDPGLSLADAVRQAAVCAALQDPRFTSVRAQELDELEIEVSILSPPVPMRSLDDLQIGRHGILVQRQGRRGLFLPLVAVEHRLDKETYLSRCCAEKAGLPADAWRHPDTEVLLFTAEVLRET